MNLFHLACWRLRTFDVMKYLRERLSVMMSNLSVVDCRNVRYLSRAKTIASISLSWIS